MLLEPLQGPCGPAPFAIVATDGDHDSIGEPMIIHGLIGTLGGLAANRVKGPIHLIQIDIGCQRAVHAANNVANFSSREAVRTGQDQPETPRSLPVYQSLHAGPTPA